MDSIRQAYSRFLKIRGTPREIALGFSLGLMVGMTPTMGFQMAIAVPLAALFKLNKLSAAAAVWITNPVTAPFIYGLTYLTGHELFGLGLPSGMHLALDTATFLTLLKQAPGFFWAMTIGGVIWGVPLAVGGYYAAYYAVHKYQAEIKRTLSSQREKHAERKAKRTEVRLGRNQKTEK